MDGVPFFIYLIMFEKNGNRLKKCKKSKPENLHVILRSKKRNTIQEDNISFLGKDLISF